MTWRRIPRPPRAARRAPAPRRPLVRRRAEEVARRAPKRPDGAGWSWRTRRLGGEYAFASADFQPPPEYRVRSAVIDDDLRKCHAGGEVGSEVGNDECGRGVEGDDVAHWS